MAQMLTDISLGLEGCYAVGRLKDQGMASPEMISIRFAFRVSFWITSKKRIIKRNSWKTNHPALKKGKEAKDGNLRIGL